MQILRPQDERLHERINSLLIIFLLQRRVSEIEIIVSRRRRHRSHILYTLESLLCLGIIPFPVQSVGKIVVRCHGKRILHQGLSIVDLSLLEVFLPEVPVTSSHILPVHLSPYRRHQKRGQKKKQYVLYMIHRTFIIF